MVTIRRRLSIPWAPGRGEERMEGKLLVRTMGTSGRPFLLLHGLGGSSRYWGATYDELTGVGRIIVPDLLGFGRSQRRTTGYTADDHADAIAGCLDSLGVGEPAIVGAHSLGCLVGLAFAARYPDRVSAVVGAGPPLYADTAAARSGISRLGWLERQFAFGNRRARWVCGWTCAHRRSAARLARFARPSIPTPILLDGLEHSWNSYSQTLEHLLLASRGEVWLSAIDRPVHLLAGDGDRVPDMDYLHALTERHPQVRLTVVSGGGHDLPLTHAPTMVAALKGALP